jgi:hypothetical protein
VSGATFAGLPGGAFVDRQSVLGGKAVQNVKLTFTATTVCNYSTPPYVDVPVFVRGFSGDWGVLSIQKTPKAVYINGDSGLDANGRPKKICD